ncbi:DUF1232 domain-containing protein [Aeromonas caviae]|uniref:YkvA family protein n=1 Tax=Aeromonas caviae TaxID=648 RepID=A0AA43AIY0_AERCA|nr:MULTISPECIES: YkvA family protein [Aeromonas]EKP0309910.1 DUF1232 domain-containing protein [Aeromonas veronii]MBS4708474.1 DUF1232 domain-containing protein [Aeromonas caviae]MDH1897754.1 YkvA family protein [Aeromonas caviae]MDH1898456.1 YkvA family protein [Aeromonas caviae]
MAETNKIEIEDYNENNFWEKVKTFCKSIGRESLEQVFRLYYALESDKCSAKHKTIIYGALAYLVSPIDMIPDLTPILGYTDDMGLIAAALVAVAVCIDDVVKTKAKEKVDELFD